MSAFTPEQEARIREIWREEEAVRSTAIVLETLAVLRAVNEDEALLVKRRKAFSGY